MIGTQINFNAFCTADKPRPGLLSTHDPMVEKQASRFERAVRDVEVLAESLDADVLDHADARDLIERLVSGERAIVANLDRHGVRQAGSGNALARQRRLWLTQRDPGRVNSVLTRRVNDQRTPTAADVEQSLAAL